MRLFAVTLFGLAVLNGATGAYADAGDRIKEMSVAKTSSSGNNIPTIRVISSDGTRWDSVEPVSPVGQMLFVKFKVVTRSWASIDNVRLMIANCFKTECYSDMANEEEYLDFNISGPHLFYQDISFISTTSISETIESSFHPVDLPISNPDGVAKWPVIDSLISACNSASPSPNNDLYLTEQTIPITLVVGTQGKGWSAAFPGSAVYSKTMQYPVRVECKRYVAPFNPLPPGSELTLDPNSGEISKLDVKLVTFLQNTPQTTTSPNPGTVCKKALLTVTAEATLAGTYQANLLKKVKEDYSSGTLDLTTQFADGKHIARHQEWISVDDTSTVEAWVNASVTADEQTPETTDYAELTLQCEGSGGTGGLQADLLPFEMTGNMEIWSPQDQMEFPPCPRKLSVRTSVRLNRPGHFVSRLVCSGGTNHLDAHTPEPYTTDEAGHINYVAYIHDEIQLKETGHLTCAMSVTHQNGEPEQLVAVQNYNGICATADPDLSPPEIGGLVTQEPDRNDDPVFRPSLVGGFQILDNSGEAATNTCPRDANAVVWFQNTKAENIHYSLDCNKLGSHSGVLQVEDIGNGLFNAAALVPLSIGEGTADTCTLRTVAPGLPRDHMTLEKDFTCATPANPSPVTGLAVPAIPRPTDKPEPSNPARTADPTPPQPDPVRPDPVKPTPANDSGQAAITCQGGVVSNGTCVCKSTEQRRQVSATRFQCIPRPNAEKTPPLVCQNGTVIGGKCRCAANSQRIKLGNRIFKCRADTKPTPSETKKPTRTSPKKTQIVCQGGAIKNGKCRCGANANRIKLGNNVFKCRKKATRTSPQTQSPKRTSPKKTQIVCQGGAVKNGKCRCGANANRVKLGNNIFKCRKKVQRTSPQTKAPQRTSPARANLVCRNGAISNGKCRCGNGLKLRKIGANRFRCIRN